MKYAALEVAIISAFQVPPPSVLCQNVKKAINKCTKERVNE